ncbi:hypothetical protein C5L31_000306 [Secundilactobacillus malefermentans]|uniref:Uncharacterized protein n=1 Tax=Secundilactobacillus malefermentans TaxID=176292 RepID=A0A4R5NL78_9LACO|nr:hypothetical protein C5L31_000306 [Secundilactobacillus malefermentans]
MENQNSKKSALVTSVVAVGYVIVAMIAGIILAGIM